MSASSSPRTLYDRPSRRVLMITNVDRGQANIFLAVAQSLIEMDPEIEIHFASFPGLEDEINHICQSARKISHGAYFPMTYHTIQGASMEEGLRQTLQTNGTKLDDNGFPVSFTKTLSFSTTRQCIRDMVPVFTPYTAPQMVAMFRSIVGIIEKVDANIILIDSLMTAALTACCHLDVDFICLSPNSIKEFCKPKQPHVAGLWKFPASFTGFKFPVPWSQIPLNIFWSFYVIKRFVGDTNHNAVSTAFTAETGAQLKTPVNYFRDLPPNLRVLVSTWSEIDFPIIKQDHVIPCGPIIGRARPLSPEFAKWLGKGSTLYINLGSLCALDETRALELARCIKVVLDRNWGRDQKLQVLWKLKKTEQYKETLEIDDLLAKYLKLDKVRIVSWIEADPAAILSSGSVVCAVHHGGANSYNEAVVAGVPQVVLPQWTDCYDYAERVELHGIGLHGSRTHKPRWHVDETSAAIISVLYGPDALSIKQNASRLADMCRAKGNGADNAARRVLRDMKTKDQQAVADHSLRKYW